jgi:hypothetical protein
LAEKAVTDNLALLERKMGTCRRPQRTSRTSCWQWKFGRTLVIRKAPSTSP